MKKIILMLVLFCLVGCNTKNENKTDKLTVVATLFPQYDFTRQIVGDKAVVTMLITPGVETHVYEPTPKDIIKINSSDLFVYTGEHMEVWANKIIDSIDNKKVKILDVSSNIKLDKIEDEHEEEIDDHEYEPHIWTDPLIASKMVDNILNSLCDIDSKNCDYYSKNAEEYQQKLIDLDKEFNNVVDNSKNKKMIFGGRFAFYYFVKRYNLEYESAYDSCMSESEPSAKTIAELNNKIKKENIKAVYYEELANNKVSKVIVEGTNAKILLFHSTHNVSKEDFKKGVTYLDLMNQNVENLKVGLDYYGVN